MQLEDAAGARSVGIAAQFTRRRARPGLVDLLPQDR